MYLRLNAPGPPPPALLPPLLYVVRLLHRQPRSRCLKGSHNRPRRIREDPESPPGCPLRHRLPIRLKHGQNPSCQTDIYMRLTTLEVRQRP